MATGGVILILFGIGILASQEASGIAMVLYLLATVVGLAVVIKLALWSIRKTGASKSIYLESDQTGYRASSWDKEMVGKKGPASTDLRPGGYIRIEGKKYSAISVAGYIEKGVEVEVIGGEGETLQVRKLG